MLVRRSVRRGRWWFALALSLGSAGGLVAAPAAGGPDPLLRATVDALGDQPGLTVGGSALASGQLLAQFYAARDYRLAWVREGQAQGLLAVVQASGADGLDPADYGPAELERLARPGALGGLSRAERLAADLRLTDALLRYVYHIRFGRLDPVAVNRAWNHRKPIPAATLIDSMERVVQAADTAAALSGLAPQPFFYANLRRALGAGARGGARSDLAPIPAEGPKLVQGSRDRRVPALRERLRATGDDRSGSPEDPEVFDAALGTALAAFQARRGLVADGVLGPGTLRALNERPPQGGGELAVRYNLERMRWLYDELPAEYVLVDVAGFMAHVIRDDRPVWSTRVVVGTPDAQTPSFRDEMEHVVFNPTWTVPPSIQSKMRGVSSRYKIVDRRTGRAVSGANVSDHRRFSIVQGPGPTNALGRVKFIFPNDHAVYLHDTQSKALFGQPVRAYSHGCVRVQDPLKLAEVLLGRQQWDQRAIDRVVATNKTRYVHLDERLPVLLYYLTAMADDGGSINLRRDIYGRDPALKRAFDGPPSPLRIAFPAPVALEAPAVPTDGPAAGPATLPPVPLLPVPRATLTQDTRAAHPLAAPATGDVGGG